MVRQWSAKPRLPGSIPGAASTADFQICAGVAEVVDAKDLKSFGPKARAGSSPALGTILLFVPVRSSVKTIYCKAFTSNGFVLF